MRPQPEGLQLVPSLPLIRGLAGGEPQCSKSGLLGGRMTFYTQRQFSLLSAEVSHSCPSSSQYKPFWRRGPTAIQIGKVQGLIYKRRKVGVDAREAGEYTVGQI